MADQTSNLGTAWWAKNLNEVDREVARMATLCEVRILDPGVIERVLKNDDTVCGVRNPAAFDKLRNALMMHYNLRTRAKGAIGETQTELVVSQIVERLKEQLGDRFGGPPSK